MLVKVNSSFSLLVVQIYGPCWSWGRKLNEWMVSQMQLVKQMKERSISGSK